MVIQIANPQIVQKIEWLASAMKVGKTAAVEKAIDALGQQWALGEADRNRGGVHARALTLLAQLDRITDRVDSFEPLTWDEQGLPTCLWLIPLRLLPSSSMNQSGTAS